MERRIPLSQCSGFSDSEQRAASRNTDPDRAFIAGYAKDQVCGDIVEEVGV